MITSIAITIPLAIATGVSCGLMRIHWCVGGLLSAFWAFVVTATCLALGAP